MPENPDAEVDPRFDPVFQRGYDPKLHERRRPRSAPRHGTEPVPIASHRQPDSEPEREPDPAPVSAGPAPVERADLDGDLVLQARNLWRLALLITSLVAIGISAWLIWTRIGEDAFYGGFSGTNQALLFRSQLVAALPVPLLTGGILGVILWLAIGAMAHRSGVDE
jgi:hypothetical protein